MTQRIHVGYHNTFRSRSVFHLLGPRPPLSVLPNKTEDMVCVCIYACCLERNKQWVKLFHRFPQGILKGSSCGQNDYKYLVCRGSYYVGAISLRTITIDLL